MGFRFHKTARLLPGLRLHFSKTGASLSLGKRGATVNLGKDGVKTTVGAPGTGMSYSSYRSYGALKKGEGLRPFLGWMALVAVIIIVSVVMNG